jgi:hypothetical protein
VQVGELVGIKDSNSPSSTEFSIGVIRRIKNWKDGLELGIQKLAPCASAIATTSAVRGEQAQRSQRSLLLPELKALGQPATIITHTWYRPGDDILARSHGHHARIRLTRLVENTGVYSQFEFRILESVQEPAKTDSGKTADSGFEAIWNQL